MRLGLNLLMIIPALLLISACKDGEQLQKVKKQVAQIKLQPAGVIEPLPVLKPIAKMTYSASQLRNPFNPSKQTAKTRQPGNRLNLNREKQPLEAFFLDSLKMVGTIGQNGKLFALIVIPKGNIYPVTVGNYLGRNHGKITQVLPDSIKILEKVQVNGQWKLQMNCKQILK